MLTRCDVLDGEDRCIEAPGHDGTHAFVKWLRLKTNTGHIDVLAGDDEPAEMAAYVKRVIAVGPGNAGTPCPRPSLGPTVPS